MKTFHGFHLDPFQEEAAEAIEQGRSLVVAAPTGAGKTLVAEYAIEKAMAAGESIIYTAPIKALSNQKYRDFTARYGDQVGIVTGDISLNPDAPLVIMTTEIFRNTIFEGSKRLEALRYLIFDEIHYIDDPERGTVWEESIIFAPSHIRFLCLSATVPNLDEFTDWLKWVRDEKDLAVIHTDHRPVPLQHRFFFGNQGPHGLGKLKEIRAKHRPQRHRRHGKPQSLNLLRVVDFLMQSSLLPCLFFSFSRKNCESLAHRFARSNLVDTATSNEITERFDKLARQHVLEKDGSLEDLRGLLTRGVGYHHAGMLPSHKEIVEQLFTARLIQMLFTTETFAMGINMPAASVVFESLEKFDGVTFGYMKRRDYLQMAGRAGRRGKDKIGHVLAIIEPEHARWNGIHQTLRGNPEPLTGRLRPSYHTLLNLYERMGDTVIQVCEQSFRRFQTRNMSKKKRKGQRIRDPEAILVQKRLLCLKQLGYIKDHALTPRGTFAAHMPAYEIQLAEFYFSGVFRDLDPDELNVLLMAISFEPKRNDWFRTIPKNQTPPFFKHARQCIKRIRKSEMAIGMPSLTQRLHFQMTLGTVHWSGGGDFSDLEHFTSASPGDLVRAFRMLYQLLRQLKSAVDPSDPLRDIVKESLKRIHRDVVDAEKQLQRTIEEMDNGYEAGWTTATDDII